MTRDLIFDIGMHDGTDTDFYLRKGFRVIAVDADPDLCARAERRFATAIASRRLVVVHRAIAARAGRVTLFRSTNTLWNTLDQARAERFANRCEPGQAVDVEATTTAELMREFGTPYYLKVDIEGLDLTALASISEVEDRPSFVSIESARHTLDGVRSELSLLASLGYDRFKVVPQHRVQEQREPDPPREGNAAGSPVRESSGLFGEDLPGRWLTEAEAADAYRRPLLAHYLTGTDALVRSRVARALLRRVGFRAGWYDTHARHTSYSGWTKL